jgi:hypothetical protein
VLLDGERAVELLMRLHEVDVRHHRRSLGGRIGKTKVERNVAEIFGKRMPAVEARPEVFDDEFGDLRDIQEVKGHSPDKTYEELNFESINKIYDSLKSASEEKETTLLILDDVGAVLNFVIAFKIRENNREQNLKKEIRNEMIKYKL